MWKVIITNYQFVKVNETSDFAKVEMEFTFEELDEAGDFVKMILAHSDYKVIRIEREVLL